MNHARAASLLVLVGGLAGPARAAHAEESKLPVHADVGIGFGQTLFFGDMKGALRSAYGGAFDPGIGNNLLVGFTVAPDSLRGVGFGARIKGTFGSSVEGEGGDDYIFNHYNLALTATVYPIALVDDGGAFGTFGAGPYARVSGGFGQMTTKRMDEATARYRHQYAIGPSIMGAIGYSQPLGPVRLALEVELEVAAREGTVDGVGSTTFRSGQLGGNLVLSL